MRSGTLHMLRRFWRNHLGGMAIEFAIVAPIFLISAFSLFQVGFGIYSQSTLARAAEEGARYLLFTPDDEQGARQAVLDSTFGTPLDPEQLTIKMTSLSTPYPHIELALNYLFQIPGPFPLPQEIMLESVVLVPVAP